jgi:hypothetical protein
MDDFIVRKAIDEWINIEKKAGRNPSKFEALKKELKL